MEVEVTVLSDRREARGPHKIPMERVATLSSLHITKWDNDNATKSSLIYAMDPSQLDKDDCNGLFVHAGEFHLPLARRELIEEGFSPAFVAAVVACLDAGASWVCFSEHGDVVPTLPTFDW